MFVTAQGKFDLPTQMHIIFPGWRCPKTWLATLFLCAGFALTTFHSTPAYAQACPAAADPTNGGDAAAGVGCDYRFRDAELACTDGALNDSGRHVWGSCPAKPMVHKRTALKTFSDLSPYSWISLRDENDPKQKYAGFLYRGSVGQTRAAFELINESNNVDDRFAGCVHQIEIPGSTTLSPEDEAKVRRLQLDNCANQYILHSGLDPENKSNPKLLVYGQRCEAPRLMSVAQECQPLKMDMSAANNEYLPSDYLNAAWKRMLQDPDYQMPARSKGFFSGLLSRVMSVINTVAGFANMMSNLSNIANIAAKLPNLGNIMSTIQGGLTGMMSTITDLPNKLSGMVGNLSNMIKTFPDAIKNLGGIADKLKNLPNALNGVQGLANKLKDLPNTLSNIKNIAGSLGNIQGMLGNLQGITASISGLPNMLNNVQGALGNLNNLSQTLQGLPNMLNNLQSLPNTLAQFENLSKTFANFGQITQGLDSLGQMTKDLENLGNIGQALQGMGNLEAAMKDLDKLQSSFGQVQDLMRTGEQLGTLADSLGSIDSLRDVIANPALQSFVNSSDELQNLMGAQSDLRELERQLRRIADPNLGIQLNGMSFAQLTNTINEIATINATLDALNLNELTNVAQSLRGLSNAFTGIPNDLGNMVADMKGAAMAFTQLNVLDDLMGQVNTMKDTLVGMADFGLSIALNFPRISVKPDPRLPSGVLIENPITPPSTYPQITLSDLTKVPAEEILDPTHPFSPRWDIEDKRDRIAKNDRDFSKSQAYLKDTTNGVFCAGDKDKKIIKVDILNFRRESFYFGKSSAELLGDGFTGRSMFNTICKQNGFPGPEGPHNPLKNPCGYYIQVGPAKVQKKLSCWKCFRMASKVDNPPCAVNYLGSDKSIIGAEFPGLGGFYISKWFKAPLIASLTAQGKVAEAAACTAGLKCPAGCTPFNLYRNSSMAELCKDLRAPYTPMNKLKMRFAKKGDPNDELPSGVPEGLTHKDYFGSNMPYPRLWDTGQSIQKIPSADQDPMDDTGQYTAIVGVGREAILPTTLSKTTPAPAASPTATPSAQPAAANTNVFGTPPRGSKPEKDERCLFGGWGPKGNQGNIRIKTPDPVSSWTELKLYQLNTTRMFGLACLGKYDKLFKVGASEDHVLAAGGGQYQERSDSCAVAPVPGQTPPPVPAAAQGRFDALMRNFPMAWRGYISDPENASQFPNFGGNGSTVTGLDNAQIGDIVMLPKGSSSAKEGLPLLGIVTQVAHKKANPNCASRGGCFVTIEERNAGKWPDACGNTEAWGINSTRQVYQPGTLPSNISDQLSDKQWIKNCEDPDLQHCEMDQWSNVKLFRFGNVERQGSNIPMETRAPTPAATPTPAASP